jgi:uncharacterized protein with gpF-like domain
MMKEVQTFDNDHGMGENNNAHNDEESKEKCVEDKAEAEKDTVAADHNYDKAGKKEGDEAKPKQQEKDEKFEPFNLEVTAYEERVTDKLVRTFDEARQVFLFVQVITTAHTQFLFCYLGIHTHTLY